MKETSTHDSLEPSYLMLALLVPSAALAEPISTGGMWSAASTPRVGTRRLQPLGLLPFWSGASWDGPFMGVGYLTRCLWRCRARVPSRRHRALYVVPIRRRDPQRDEDHSASPRGRRACSDDAPMARSPTTAAPAASRTRGRAPSSSRSSASSAPRARATSSGSRTSSSRDQQRPGLQRLRRDVRDAASRARAGDPAAARAPGMAALAPRKKRGGPQGARRGNGRSRRTARPRSTDLGQHGPGSGARRTPSLCTQANSFDSIRTTSRILASRRRETPETPAARSDAAPLAPRPRRLGGDDGRARQADLPRGLVDQPGD